MNRGSTKEVINKKGSSSDHHDSAEEGSVICKSRLSSLLASTHRDFLLSPTNTQVKIADLQDKVVGIYFSANWHKPCCDFTLLLTKVYDQLNKNNYSKDEAGYSSCSSITTSFEVIFVSSDEDVDTFNKYRATMPWLSVPFEDIETRRILTNKFDIEAMPSLVVLQPGDVDSKGSEATTILNDGVEIIYRYGIDAFPFTKQRLEELQLKEKERHENQNLVSLLTTSDRNYVLAAHPPNNLQQVPVLSLEGKTVGLFFSAKWCAPGMIFTSKLITIFQNIKQSLKQNNKQQEAKEDFEIIFISTDRDQQSFESYFNTMPWLSLPFKDPTIKSLTKYFDIRAIPCLIILGPDGKTVTKQGRNLVNLYGEDAYPFTEAKLDLLEKLIYEEAMKLPRSVLHEGHPHELNLVSEGTGGGPFICCVCDEQGAGWAYQCLQCGYEVHTKCVKTVGNDEDVIPAD